MKYISTIILCTIEKTYNIKIIFRFLTNMGFLNQLKNNIEQKKIVGTNN